MTDGAVDARFGASTSRGIAADSRKVKRGDLFVAVPGTKADGLAVRRRRRSRRARRRSWRSARRTSCPRASRSCTPTNVRRALALAAARFYPRQPETIAAVTGTSGKTSVAAFTRQIWAALGHEAASIGTIGLVTPQQEVYGSLTTPDPIELARTLDRLAEDGITHLAMEASSHGLDQHRIDGVRVTVGGFTNLSRDHMDYHATRGRLSRGEADPVRAHRRGRTARRWSRPTSRMRDTSSPLRRERGLQVLTVGRNGDGIRLRRRRDRRLLADAAARA